MVGLRINFVNVECLPLCMRLRASLKRNFKIGDLHSSLVTASHFRLFGRGLYFWSIEQHFSCLFLCSRRRCHCLTRFLCYFIQVFGFVISKHNPSSVDPIFFSLVLFQNADVCPYGSEHGKPPQQKGAWNSEAVSRK